MPVCQATDETVTNGFNVCIYKRRACRKKYRQHSVMRYLRAIYGRLYGIKILKGKKLPENMTFYGQSDWFTLSEKCVKNIILYLKLNPNYYDIYRNSLIGSELFFNSMAFLTKEDEDIIKQHNNLRYIDFVNVDKNTPGSPKLLKEEDYEKVKNIIEYEKNKKICK